MIKKKQTVMVEDCMSKSPVTISSSDSLQSALDLLCKYDIRELPVIDYGRLAGIVTDRDLRQVSPSYPVFRDQQEIRCYLQNLKVASAMTVDPLVVSPQTPLVQAAELLHTHRIGSLPVVENEKLVGILSVSDLLKVFIEQYK
jgi:acetoin utilization protein AcuB